MSSEHVQVTQQVRQLLSRAQELQSGTHTGTPSSEVQQIVGRAARMQHFLTQPFYVAEPFTDIPGAYVPVAQTIQGCKAILDGKYDEVPIEAFDYVGPIEQVRQK